MAKFVSQKNPVSMRVIKRKPAGSVVLIHSGREDIKFVRVHGGWCRSREDVTSEKDTIVSSTTVANDCDRAVGCESSWAKVY